MPSKKWTNMSRLTGREAAAQAAAYQATIPARKALVEARTAFVEAKETLYRLEADHYKAWNDAVSESLRESE